MNVWTILAALLIALGTTPRFSSDVDLLTKYSVQTEDTHSASTSTELPPNSVPPENSDLATVIYALEHQGETWPMRISFYPYKFGPPIVLSEFESPERFYLGNAEVGYKYIEGKAYERIAGQWRENPSLVYDLEAAQDQSMFVLGEEKIPRIIAAEKIGEERWRLEMSDVYLITINDPSVAPGPYYFYVYLRHEDGKVVGLETTEDSEQYFRLVVSYDPAILVPRPVH